MMAMLELSRFHWTPQEILEIPDAWADDILKAHSYGEIVHEETKKKSPAR